MTVSPMPSREGSGSAAGDTSRQILRCGVPHVVLLADIAPR